MFSVLKKGSKVGVIAPSSPFNENGLNPAIDWLKQKGFNPVLGNHIFEKERFLAGVDENRAKDIMTFFEDKKIEAIFSARGGYGSARTLDLLDYDIIKANPKPLVGLSDTTALQLAILKKSGLVTLSGLSLHSDLKDGALPPVTEQSLFALLRGEKIKIEDFKTIVKGKAEGKLIGGCLSLFVSLLGTPYMPDCKNAILVFEDIGEEPFRVDRMLNQIKLAGVFDEALGVIFGNFKDCVSKDENDGTIEEVISDNIKNIKIPTIINFNYGHQKGRYVLPIGAKCLLDANNTFLDMNI